MIRFLFQSIVGTLFLAFLGLLPILFAAYGVSQDFSREEETAPTPLAVADFEKDGKIPPQRWLEVADGYLIWSLKSEVVVSKTDAKGKQVGGETVRAVFVPMVSKEVAKAAKAAGEDATFPIEKVRVFFRYDAQDFPARVLKQEGDPDYRAKLAGMAHTLDKEEKLVREELFPKSARIDQKTVLIVNYGQIAPTRGVSICLGTVCAGVGLVFMLPLIVRLIRGAPKPRV
jgi:hypothetical protein